MEFSLHFHKVIYFQIYLVYLPLHCILPNRKNSGGSHLFLLSKAVTFHLLKDLTPHSFQVRSKDPTSPEASVHFEK